MEKPVVSKTGRALRVPLPVPYEDFFSTSTQTVVALDAGAVTFRKWLVGPRVGPQAVTWPPMPLDKRVALIKAQRVWSKQFSERATSQNWKRYYGRNTEREGPGNHGVALVDEEDSNNACKRFENKARDNYDSDGVHVAYVIKIFDIGQDEEIEVYDSAPDRGGNLVLRKSVANDFSGVGATDEERFKGYYHDRHPGWLLTCVELVERERTLAFALVELHPEDRCVHVSAIFGSGGGAGSCLLDYITGELRWLGAGRRKTGFLLSQHVDRVELESINTLWTAPGRVGQSRQGRACVVDPSDAGLHSEEEFSLNRYYRAHGFKNAESCAAGAAKYTLELGKMQYCR